MPFGRYFLQDIDFSDSSWASEHAPFDVQTAPGERHVATYLPELALARVEVDDRDRLDLATEGFIPVESMDTRVERDATHRLREPLLASTHAGQLAVRGSDDGLLPETALYRVSRRTGCAGRSSVRRSLTNDHGRDRWARGIGTAQWLGDW